MSTSARASARRVELLRLWDELDEQQRQRLLDVANRLGPDADIARRGTGVGVPAELAAVADRRMIEILPIEERESS